MIEIRELTKSDSLKAKQFIHFVSELVYEDTYLLIDKLPSLKFEKAWLKDKLKSIQSSNRVLLCAWHGKNLIGYCDAGREKYKNRNNVGIGLCVSKDFRGKGLGEKLLRAVIRLAKKKLKPKNIYLSVYSENKPAIALYKKLGFKEFARFPNWTLHKGKYHDSIYMILENRLKK
ncbi:GNAT family N-acetyltransferase [Candidatus Micrarchaeota archaeon]|nr:GNAT family N-acetyltransferase [Candidatus Micrarchaeota archaeon]